MIPPDVAVDAEPTVCTQLNATWMGYVIGLLEHATSPGFWDENQDAGTDYMKELLSILSLGNCLEVEVDYPHNVTLFAHAARVLAGNAQSLYVFDLHAFEHIFYQTPSAIGDKLEWAFCVDSNPYTVKIIGVKQAWSGKVRWMLDGTDNLAEIDMYNATTVLNYVTSFAAFIDPPGRHIITAEVFGKHASSAGYDHALTCFSLSPQL